MDRAHTLRRFIDLAFILQSGTYGNLFSFISIMQGLTSPQVSAYIVHAIINCPTYMQD